MIRKHKERIMRSRMHLTNITRALCAIFIVADMYAILLVWYFTHLEYRTPALIFFCLGEWVCVKALKWVTKGQAR